MSLCYVEILICSGLNFLTYGHMPISEKYPAHAFFQKMAPKSPPILLRFLTHIDVLMLCRNFEPIPAYIFQVTVI